MVSVAPYLIRAYHQWMEDVQLTPHILVDCLKSGVVVPKPYIQQSKIVLNISTAATDTLLMNNETISFKARFDGKTQSVSVPINAILSVYAGENGEGMFFENKTAETQQDNKPDPKLTLLD